MYFLGIVCLTFFVSGLQIVGCFDGAKRALLVDLHTRARSSVSPKATDMMKMEYSEDLELSAASLASKCVWKHGKGDVSQRKYKEFGQNFFSGPPANGGADLTRAITMWDNERENYDYEDNTCSGVCGHYTQVVWAASNLVGCAEQLCPTIEGLPHKGYYFVICNYYPPGNMNKLRPYKSGPACSACPSGFSCINNQCDTAKKDSGGGSGGGLGSVHRKGISILSIAAVLACSLLTFF